MTATRCLSEHDFPAPVSERWFEDYEVGARHEYGYVRLDEADVLDSPPTTTRSRSISTRDTPARDPSAA